MGSLSEDSHTGGERAFLGSSQARRRQGRGWQAQEKATDQSGDKGSKRGGPHPPSGRLPPRPVSLSFQGSQRWEPSVGSRVSCHLALFLPLNSRSKG